MIFVAAVFIVILSISHRWLTPSALWISELIVAILLSVESAIEALGHEYGYALVALAMSSIWFKFAISRRRSL